MARETQDAQDVQDVPDALQDGLRTSGGGQDAELSGRRH